jgi:RNA 2',3'-cyclic 3'-phosphodiesterase
VTGVERPGIGVPTRRLFFALWPDEMARQSLAQGAGAAVRRCGGRPVPTPSLHLTLTFIGSVSLVRVGELESMARSLAMTQARSAPLDVELLQLVHWPRPQILCALAAQSSGVRDLAAALLQGATAGGFSPDPKPFQPHVTLARKVRKPPELPRLRPVTWRFASFALVDSRTDSAGPVYSVVASFPLVKTEKADE